MLNVQWSAECVCVCVCVFFFFFEGGGGKNEIVKNGWNGSKLMSFLKQILSYHDFAFLLSSNNSQAENLN